MSSVRLKGKMLKDFCGRPLLSGVYDRVSQAKAVTRTIIATSSHASDDELVDYCKKTGYPYFRGSLEDVSSRFLDICRIERQDSFIRISGDSPLIDPELVDKLATEHKKSGVDIVTNVLRRTFPKGQSVEVVRRAALYNAYSRFTNSDQYEHVTSFFYENPEKFSIRNIPSGVEFGKINLSVDTAQDLERLRELATELHGSQMDWHMLASRYLERFPDG